MGIVSRSVSVTTCHGCLSVAVEALTAMWLELVVTKVAMCNFVVTGTRMRLYGVSSVKVVSLPWVHALDVVVLCHFMVSQ